MKQRIARIAWWGLMGLVFIHLVESERMLAQVNKTKVWSVKGQYDSEFPLPVIEGKAGEKDPSALSEIHDFATVTTPPNWPGIEATGNLMVGGGETIKEYPASLVIEKGAKYRLDVHAGSRESSVRVNGLSGASLQADGKKQYLPVTQLGGPFFLPSELWKLINQPGTSVVDDGNVKIEGQQMHKITVMVPLTSQSSQTPAASNNVTAATFYFDPVRHYLLKKVLLGHYPGDVLQQYLQVITYNDYRSVGGAAVPYVISETNNGQHSMTFQASEVSKTSDHESSYFNF